MKILISESQLINLIQEVSRLDDLLDKMNQVGGYDKLSDQEREDLMRLSKGEEPETKQDSDYQEEVDPYLLFMHYALEHSEFEVEGKRYETEKIEEDDGEHIRVVGYDDNLYIYVTPFYQGREGVSVVTVEGKKYNYKLPTKPTDEGQIHSFVNDFYTSILPEIVKKLT